MGITGGHHYGMSCHVPHGGFPPLLFGDGHVVYFVVRKVRWCSVHSVAVHSFVWPREAREAKSIARTLFTNHGGWADVLVVRGRCFCSHGSCLAASRVLEHVLWHWSTTSQTYLVYKEGDAETSGGDRVPSWLERSA